LISFDESPNTNSQPIPVMAADGGVTNGLTTQLQELGTVFILKKIALKN
jgi:hypothetical protein